MVSVIEFIENNTITALLATSFLIILEAFVLVVVIVRVRGNARYFQHILGEVEGAELKDMLETFTQQVSEQGAQIASLTQSHEEHKAESLKHFSRVGLIRFNPYNDTGGNQSFSLCMLDAHGDGFVVSSLHGRGATRVYAKPIKDGKQTEFTLSDEEKSALSQALGKKK